MSYRLEMRLQLDMTDDYEAEDELDQLLEYVEQRLLSVHVNRVTQSLAECLIELTGTDKSAVTDGEFPERDLVPGTGSRDARRNCFPGGLTIAGPSISGASFAM